MRCCQRPDPALTAAWSGAPAVGLVISQLPPTATGGEYGQGR